MIHSNTRGRYNGPNYCPNCRCNIRAIALALEAAEHIDANGDAPATSQNGNGIAALVERPKRAYTRRRSRMVITDEMRATVLKLRAQKASISEIEKQTGMTRASISNTIYNKSKMALPAPAPDANVTIETKGIPHTKNAPLIARIVSLTKQNTRQIAIAQKLSIPVKAVRRIQKEQGIAPTMEHAAEHARS